jgi:hypothetical protein
VHEDDALFWAVALRGCLQHVHQTHQRDVESEDGVLSVSNRIGEEGIALEALFVVDVLLFAVAHDHVVKALERVARYLGPLTHDLQILLEAAFPVQVSIAVVVLQSGNARNHLAHEQSLPADPGLRCCLTRVEK